MKRMTYGTSGTYCTYATYTTYAALLIAAGLPNIQTAAAQNFPKSGFSLTSIGNFKPNKWTG